mgnify:CR=1 FL=1
MDKTFLSAARGSGAFDIDEGRGIDLDQGAAQKAGNLHSSASRQVCTEALAAHPVVFGVLIQAREPRGDTHDMLERALRQAAAHRETAVTGPQYNNGDAHGDADDSG